MKHIKLLVVAFVAIMIGLSGMNAAFANSEGSASASVKTKVKWDYIVEQVGIAKSKVATGSNKCFTDNGGGLNTGLINGQPTTWIEEAPVKWCPSKKPITFGGKTYHWVKVGGGASGSKCFNPGVPGTKNPPKPKLPRGSLVLDVKNMSKAKFNFWMSANSVVILDELQPCPGGGYIKKYGKGEASFTGRTNIKIAAFMGASFRGGGNIQLMLEQHLAMVYKAMARTNVNVQITGECPTPPPPPVDVCPDIPGTQPPGTDCTPPVPETPGPEMQSITLVNFVYVGHQISLNISGTVAPNQTAELFCKALNGGTVTSATRRQNVPSGSFDRSIDYVAPGEIPDVLTDGSGNVVVPAGHDMVECTITQANGKSDTIRTQVGPGKFDIREVPPQSE